MIILHICCGPCSIYPISHFKERGINFKGYFYNPNIHPYKEFRQRIKALEEIQKIFDFEVIWDKEYGLRKFIKETFMLWDKPGKRCERCYIMRLTSTVKKALELKASAFTTTMLYSIHQNHELLKEIAEDLSYRYKIPFFYEDFRIGYQKGKETAKNLNIYIQGYCGCIFSEEERYSKKRKKELIKELKKSET
uniref:Epoxyqueuosine reductase QueH n=1 Tax=Thermodesulfobacterium geofontis TaxID=1295609 RepID=A0A7C4NSX1_9BACT